VIDPRWDEAIQFGEEELRRNEEELQKTTKRRKQLQMAIRLLRRNRDDGLPWPESKPEGENTK
jgi:hypothetical protein